mmetsp:Transcript_9069/g.12335  ORF Transcript_9069/g.12335 Transcript_9069/m.12335 type:complete len:96 (+) Transcript_9069:850-1137(+)
MKDKSLDAFSSAGIISSVLYTIVFTIVGVYGVYMFGSSTQDDFLNNLAELDGSTIIFCRISFCLILMCHISYNFFPIKEQLLIMYDEYYNRSMSL